MILLNEVFILRKIFDVYLLIPTKSNTVSNDVLSLNRTVAIIVQEGVHATDTHDLANLVCEKFTDIDRDEIMPEIESYIKSLISSGILVER